LLGYRGGTETYHLKKGARMNIHTNVVSRIQYASFELHKIWGFNNLTPIIADASDPHTVLHGLTKRLLNDTGVAPNANLMRRFKNFCYMTIRKMYEPIPYNADISVSSWLPGTNYTQLQQVNFTEMWKTVSVQFPDYKVNYTKWKKYFKIHPFVKKEEFEQKKEARGIYAREDVSKLYFGPFAKLMEKQVYYANKPGVNYLIKFAKSIKDRTVMQYMKENFSASENLIQTDFSSFEGSFDPIFMKACEVQLYKFMLKNYPNVSETFCRLAGTNYLSGKFFSAQIEGCRMSGDMITSLSNGFSNMMIHLFLAACHNQKLEAGIVEGDDGVFSYAGKHAPVEDQYAQLGFIIKIENKKDYMDTSFCSVIYDQVGGTKLYSPTEFLTRFNWSHHPTASSSRIIVKDRLLCMKALSYLAEFPNAPVVGPISYEALNRISNWGLNETVIEKILNTDKGMKYWLSRENLSIIKLLHTKLVKPRVSRESRQLCELRYGMTVEQQLYAEEHFFDRNAHWPWLRPDVGTMIVETNRNDVWYLRPRITRCYAELFQHRGPKGNGPYELVYGSGEFRNLKSLN
jgi:hypothetical protein